MLLRFLKTLINDYTKRDSTPLGVLSLYYLLFVDNMYEIIEETYQNHIIPIEAPFHFFEACSPRKIGNTYYLIYSPRKGSRLDYATSSSPMGFFEYRCTIIDNGIDYPAGNNHGSICCINGQWYIFYHRMTNGTIMSRRACVEKIELLPDGTIPQVEMTSIGFEICKLGCCPLFSIFAR